MPGKREPSVPRPPVAAFHTEQYTLSNGLRVVLAPEHSSPVVGVCVNYDVGSRSEPADRAGFAHLFEHLMFQGAADGDGREHIAHIQGSGGTANASTHLDRTEFYEVLPAHALERALFLEAGRMRAPRLTEPVLRSQVAVVAGEIRGKSLDTPFGGFPGAAAANVLFDGFRNTRDGYASHQELRGATIEDAEDFFTRHYTPGNAVLTVTGDFGPGGTAKMVDRYFSEIAARPAAPTADLDEPPLAASRHRAYLDPRAPVPAFAIAWRVPDPVANMPEFLPYVLLNEVLTGTAASRLMHRLVVRDAVAVGVGGRLGTHNETYTARHPTALLTVIHLRPGRDVGTALRVVDEELQRTADSGLEEGELAAAQARLSAVALGALDGVLDRSRRLGAWALRHRDAALAGWLPRLLTEVTDRQVVSAAQRLSADHRAVVEVVPGGQG